MLWMMEKCLTMFPAEHPDMAGIDESMFEVGVFFWGRFDLILLYVLYHFVLISLVLSGRSVLEEWVETLTWWGSLLTAPSTELMDYYVIHEYSSNESERGTGNPLFDDRCVSRIRLSLHRCEPYEEGFIYRAGRIFTMDLALFLTFLEVFFVGRIFN